jgi:hypothetical protein
MNAWSNSSRFSTGRTSKLMRETLTVVIRQVALVPGPLAAHHDAAVALKIARPLRLVDGAPPTTARERRDRCRQSSSRSAPAKRISSHPTSGDGLLRV